MGFRHCANTPSISFSFIGSMCVDGGYCRLRTASADTFVRSLGNEWGAWMGHHSVVLNIGLQ